jgi:hypothetical protein
MRAPWRVLVALTGVVAVAASMPVLRSAAGSGVSTAGTKAKDPPKVLEIYMRSPVLVRAGEQVRLPVRVVCATAEGQPCSASVTLATRNGGDGAWQLTTTPATPSLEFDLTAPVARAAEAGAGSVEFYARADGPAGAVAFLPTSGSVVPQRFFLTARLPVIRARPIPFGRVRSGATALFLPWGSGPRRAGLAPGRESATLGPSSFDVDRQGRIYLADALQDRIAVFSGGRLLHQTPLPLSARADVSATAGGAVFVMDGRGSRVLVRRVDRSGGVGPTLDLGPGILGQIRTHGEDALVQRQPSGQWATVSDHRGSLKASQGSPGRVVPGGQLVRVIGEDHLRLGMVRHGRVVDAVEVGFSQGLGELALAEPDGHGGYWAVVHVWRDAPSPMDQYHAIHVVGERIVAAFAMGDARFADTLPLARFRLGHDGSLYQLMTGPNGVRIVRYALGRQS